MKKLLLSSIFAVLLSFSSQAFASTVTDQVQAAIAAGNFDQIATIAAANPTAQGEIGLFLLQQAQSKITSNPDQAASIFAAAEAYVSQIPAAQSGNAASIISSIVGTVNGAGFQSAHPAAAGKIFAAAVGMSNQPNIVAADANLHATVVADANTFSDSHPDQTALKSVLLAQIPGATPENTNTGLPIPPPDDQVTGTSTTGTSGNIIPSQE